MKFALALLLLAAQGLLQWANADATVRYLSFKAEDGGTWLKADVLYEWCISPQIQSSDGPPSDYIACLGYFSALSESLQAMEQFVEALSTAAGETAPVACDSRYRPPHELEDAFVRQYVATGSSLDRAAYFAVFQAINAEFCHGE